MAWYVFTILANLSAVLLEYLYRTGFLDGFIRSLPVIIPLAIVVQFGLYHSFREAPSFLLSWATFSALNAIMRVIANYFLGEYFGWKTFFGIILIVLGVFLIRLK
jgi:drug/metabolite transporter (DMT)-like permease